MQWLFKEEPSNYSYDALERDGKTSWTGVKNPLAQKHLRSVQKGDRIFFYHTGDEKAVVGLARVTKAAYPDPKAKDPKLLVVELTPVRPLSKQVTLAAIKADALFKDSPLVRQGRLSVVNISDAQFARLAT